MMRQHRELEYLSLNVYGWRIMKDDCSFLGSATIVWDRLNSVENWGQHFLILGYSGDRRPHCWLSCLAPSFFQDLRVASVENVNLVLQEFDMGRLCWKKIAKLKSLNMLPSLRVNLNLDLPGYCQATLTTMPPLPEMIRISSSVEVRMVRDQLLFKDVAQNLWKLSHCFPLILSQ